MIAEALKQSATTHLEEGVARIRKCLELISREELWTDPNAHLVSPGKLVKHLCGNVSQYVLAGLGKQAYRRDRRAEFAVRSGECAADLLRELEGVVRSATGVIRELSEQDLIGRYEIQGFTHTGVGALVHVVEHFSYHVGQITYAVKLMRDVDVGYYAGADLDLP